MSTAAHPVRWLTAAPLWSSLLADAEPSAGDLDRMQRPAILRLRSDDFMDELAALLGRAPDAVAELEAVPESFRPGPPGAPDAYAPPIDHVKLFQPVHGHFNLVAATLVCRVAGLPDRAVDLAGGDEAGFVLRRVSGPDELAWTGATWQAAGAALADGEQLLPLFGMPYAEGDRTRRLFVGLVPTASLETFRSGGAVSFSPQPGDRSGDPPDRRPDLLDETVIEPLRAVTAAAPPGSAWRTEPSRFVLLDLGEFLLRHAPQLWDAVTGRRRPAVAALAAAYDALTDHWADIDRNQTWLDAVLGAWADRERIWDGAPTYAVDLSRGTMDPALLRARLIGALPDRTAAERQEPQPPFEAPKVDPRPGTRYVIRCVYRRPHCGPLQPDCVSDPSRPFAIASFFDLDAPARPITIALPVDTTIAGLRKAPKNVRFLISRELRAQMDRVKDLQKALDKSIDDAQELDLGFICAFSIPIITICALIVLLIFLYLLNIVFWWLPFFRICFPIPLRRGG